MLVKLFISMSVFNTRKKIVINHAVHEVMRTTYVLVVWMVDAWQGVLGCDIDHSAGGDAQGAPGCLTDSRWSHCWKGSGGEPPPQRSKLSSENHSCRAQPSVDEQRGVG